MHYAFCTHLSLYCLVLFPFLSPCLQRCSPFPEGLPEDPRLNRFFRRITLETGLIFGGSLMLLGLGGSVWAVSHWARDSFGALNPDQMLRIIMPAAFSLTLGAAIIFSSFFLSILCLRRRE